MSDAGTIMEMCRALDGRVRDNNAINPLDCTNCIGYIAHAASVKVW
jgi:hypothetical protein